MAWASVFLSVLPRCGQAAPNRDRCPSRPEALIVVDGARHLECETTDGTYQVTYEIAERYPADATLSRIRSELSRLGWRPLDEDFLNPGVPSSHRSGWTSFEDSTTEPRSLAHQWYAQWEAPNGDIVAFGLLYRSPLSGANAVYEKPAVEKLTVSAKHLPCEIVRDAVRTLPGDPRQCRQVW